MAKGLSLGVNPAEAYRKQMQKRGTKRNKEVRDKMREVGILYKDTTVMERKIEQFRGILRTRKMTAAEKEKLNVMEAELAEVIAKQKEAGITPRKRNNDEKAVGFDPMAATTDNKNALVQYASSEEDSAEDTTCKSARIGETVLLEGDIFNTSEDRELNSDSSSESGNANKATDPDALPPLPPGTPPLLSSDIDFGIWPPLPSGPSPLFIQNNPHTSTASQERGQVRGRGRGRGRGSNHGRVQRQRPYERHSKSSDKHYTNNSNAGGPPHSHSNGMVPPGVAYPVATSIRNVSGYRPPQPPRQPVGPVLSAEPQVRDLKKELTTLVPSAIARKNKQKERQRVLAAVPTAPIMVVNAAPDVDDGSNASKHTLPTSENTLGTMRHMEGVRFSTTSKSGDHEKEVTSNTVAEGQNQVRNDNKGTLDDEYQRFMDQVSKL
ncbi:hypothetical protein H4S08_003687 [Coemansia sp. RSA 1365]|nr:hypothetical protein H4S08_003687 [Coemansia sp. RSA 1365]